MKTIRLILPVFLVFVLFGCSPKNDIDVSVTGSVTSEVSQRGLPNYKLFIKVYTVHGSGLLSYENVIEEKHIETDSNGNFKVTLDHDGDVTIFAFYSVDSDVYTSLMSNKTSFFYNDVVSQPLQLSARAYEKLHIHVKNVNQFNENDLVSIEVYQTNTNYFNSVVSSIENFGISNLPLVLT